MQMFKVFPVNKAIIRPFRGQLSLPLFADIDTEIAFNWNTNDETTLVNTFKQQLEENVYTFIRHNIYCSKLIDKNEFSDDFFMGLSKEETLDRCLKFVSPSVASGYVDTFHRDTEVFLEVDGEKTSQIFAVVLLSADFVYQGHIYMWITGSSCIAFGIRGRPDKMFQKTRELQVANVLIDKIVALALERGCTQVVIPNPLPVMKNLLLSMFEFTFKRVPIIQIGNTFMGYAHGGKIEVGAAVKQLIEQPTASRLFDPNKGGKATVGFNRKATVKKTIKKRYRKRRFKKSLYRR
jgi:hypothetical protein